MDSKDGTQSESQIRSSELVRCAMTDKDGTCREPATVEIYSIHNQMWYPLCAKHRLNIIAPTRKISQPNGASNNKVSEAGPLTPKTTQSETRHSLH